MTTASLVDIVFDRLEASPLDRRASDLVLGALAGDLEAAIRGSSSDRPARADDPTSVAEPAVAFLESLAVRGFRGIGKRAMLELTPGPGLTLVVGRNGSGKSSFAEALELLLTGDNARWAAKKNRIWRDGWRNLHVADEPVEIEATLFVVGQNGATRLRRSWPAGATLEQGATSVVAEKVERASRTVGDLGWEQPLAAFRPFLSYEELGSMLDEGPSKLFDKLSSILGVEELVEAADRLKEGRLEREQQDKSSKETAKALAARCADLAQRGGDERAVAATAAFAKRG
jgi:energy-coupling factor transporter ATP-binding protein EcfA2